MDHVWPVVLTCLVSFGCAPPATPATPAPPSPEVESRPLALTRAEVQTMIVFDLSGSMNTLLPDCTAGCTSRIDAAKALTRQVLTSSPEIAFGLVTYPGDRFGGACAPANTVDVPIDGSRKAETIAAIEVQLDAANSFGGTPTAETLEFVAGLPYMRDREAERVILLVSDGLPNCGTAPVPPDQCQCTSSPCPVPYDSRVCIDQTGIEHALATLEEQGIELYAIGVGEAWSPPEGQRLLQRLGKPLSASGVANHLTEFAQVNTLASALNQRLSKLAACSFTYLAPGTPGAITVTIDGAPLSPEHFDTAGAQLRLDEESCDRVAAGATITASFGPKGG